MAIFILPYPLVAARACVSAPNALDLVGGDKAVDEPGSAAPVESAEAMARGDEARARIEHPGPGVARAEPGANGVPRGLEHLHFLLRRQRRGTLGLRNND